MTEQQITTYEYCTEYLKCIKTYKEKIPFGIQKYGCGTGRPSIEFTLDNMHAEMYRKVIAAICETEDRVRQIIEKI